MRGDGCISQATAQAALKMLDVDANGFDLMDRKLLLTLIERFDGGPAGIDNLAAAIGETAPVRRMKYRGAGFAWDRPPAGEHDATRVPDPGAGGRRRLMAEPWPELAEMSAAQVAGFFAMAFAARADP